MKTILTVHFTPQITQIYADERKKICGNLRNLRIYFLLLGVIALLLVGCQTAVIEPVQEPTAAATIPPEPTVESTATITPEPTEVPTSEPTAVSEMVVEAVEYAPETAVIDIPLAGALTNPSAEISGMAWYGDWLILLPQYPFFNRDGQDGALYALPKADIDAFINGESDAPLEPQPILLDSSLRHQIAGYEGYEAIAFVGDTVYLTIEASSSDGMMGYLVRGQMEPDLSGVTFFTETAVILPQATLANKTDEAILLIGDEVLTMYEANGLLPNPNPVAHIFGADLAEKGTMPFPRMEYRVTDATEIDENGRFWVINYNFPSENGVQTDDDPIAAQYGKGATHADRDGVERLVELQYSPDGISRIDAPPVQLQLLPDELRNWEGIVRFNDGWLLATDKYPTTMLGYVPQLEE